MIRMYNRHSNLTYTVNIHLIYYLDLFKTIYIILLLEGLAVHAKLFCDPLVDRDRRLAQGYFKFSVTVHILNDSVTVSSLSMSWPLTLMFHILRTTAFTCTEI
jgi:hypothetical protein